MSGHERDEALRVRTAQAVDRWAERRAERARRGPLATAGDLFLLGEGDEVMEWVILQVDAASERALAAPADTHSMAGRTDLSVDDGGSGPLTLRCGSTSWIDLGRFEIDRLSGFVEEETVARALDLWHGIQAGELSKAALTDSEIDPEYRELLEETARKAKAILDRASSPKRAEGPLPVPFPERQATGPAPRWRRARPRVMPALFPALSLALFALLVWQWRDSGALRDERLRPGPEYPRPPLASAEPTSTGSGRPEERTSRSAAVAPVPLVNVPLAWLTPQETVRGRAPVVTAPSGEEYFFVVLEVQDRGRGAPYLLEVRREDGPDLVLRLPGLRRGAGNIVTLALPQSALPAGQYRLSLRQGPGEGRTVHEYALRITAAADATSSPR